MHIKKFGINQRTHFRSGWTKFVHIGIIKGVYYLTVFVNSKPVSGRTFKSWQDCENHILKLTKV